MASQGNTGAARYLPGEHTLPELRRAAAGCRGCGLYRDATQTVFGEGPPDARFLFVGEQPGTRRTSKARRSSAPPGGSWTERSRRRASIAEPSM